MLRRVGWFVLMAIAVAGCTSSGEAANPSDTPAEVATASPTRLPVEPSTTSAAATATPWPTASPTASPSLPAPVATVDPIDQTGTFEGMDHLGSVMVWTGDEIIFWGGSRRDSNVVVGFPGRAFDPDTETWRELAAAPDGYQAEAAGFWTGEEVIICCGKAGSAPARSTQLYDPKTDTWRLLPAPPFNSTVGGASAAMSGDDLYVVGPEQLLKLDLTTEEWSELTAPPTQITFSPGPSLLAISNGDLVLWARPARRRAAQGLHYVSAVDEWNKLPAPPVEAWPAIADLVWTGDELIVVGGRPGNSGPPEQLVGARLDWSAMTWRALPDVWPQPIPFEGNLGSQSVAWTGDRLVVVAGALGSGFDPLDSVTASYDPREDRWFRLSGDPGVQFWHRPLLAFDDRVVMPGAAELFVSQPGWASDESRPIPDEGLRAAPRVPFDDLLPRTDTPLTIVGATGNGAGIVVIDLDIGLRSVYDATQHSLGVAPITDMTMVDRDLYVWRTGESTVRFDGGPGPWDGRGDRLTWAELAQPAMSAGEVDAERFVLPVPALEASWVWGRVADRSQARLAPFDGSPSKVVAEFEEQITQFGRSGAGALVLSDYEQTTLALWPDGSSVEMGVGEPLAIAGDEVLLQVCERSSCARRWANLKTAAERAITEDEWRWVSVAGPSIPGHSARLEAASGNGEQILIGRRLASKPTTEYGLVDLLRVEVATGVTAPLPLGKLQSSLAVWSRSGEQVVTFGSDGDIIVVDIDTNKVSTIRGAMPDGFFVLAAG